MSKSQRAVLFCPRAFVLLTGLLLPQGMQAAGGLSLSATTGVQGGPLLINVVLAPPADQPLDIVKWTLHYPPADLTLVNVGPGPAAIAAQKEIACSFSAGSFSCLLLGLNHDLLGAGILATVIFNVSPGTRSGVTLTLDSATAAAPDGNALVSLSATGTSAMITPPPITSLKIASTVPPPGPQHAAYFQTLSATGGASFYGWSIAGGTLPPGLGFSPSTGTISGTPSATGSWGFIVQVRDSTGMFVQRAFVISIYNAGEVLSHVVSNASFGPAISPGSWIAIEGTGLSNSTRSANANDAPSGSLPSLLDDVSITVAGEPAFLSYISPTQINTLMPSDISAGPAQVQLFLNHVPGPVLNVTVAALAPAMFLWKGNQVVATHTDFSLVAPPGEFTGITTVPAHPGEVIILWGTGFGPTTPPVASGKVTPADVLYNVTTPLTVTIGGTRASFVGAALAPGQAGVYQIAIRVPAAAADGDLPVLVEMGSVSSPAGALLAVKH